MVAFCVLLVAIINIASENNFGGSLFGSLTPNAESQTEMLRNKISIENSRKNNLATIAVLNADSSFVPEEAATEEELAGSKYNLYEPVPDINSQIVLAIAGPQMTAISKNNRGMRTYAVREGDTVGSIAAANGVSVNTILWANNLTETTLIKPGDKLVVLPITGTRHKVQRGDSLESIAKKYGADSQKILAFNELTADGSIKEGQEIIIPDGFISAPTTGATGTRLAIAGQTPAASSASAYAPIRMSGGGTGHRFPYGYCTWYVSQRRYVPWGGNAGAWLSNARASGKATGSAPKPGAIIVTGESRWGHVGIVEKVSGNTVTVSEMNYAGFGKKSTRTINANSRTVKGFIY